MCLRRLGGWAGLVGGRVAPEAQLLSLVCNARIMNPQQFFCPVMCVHEEINLFIL